MQKCDKCNDAILYMELRPQMIKCKLTGKTFIYGQRVNCPKDEEKRK